jgi:hypothetical protein
MGGQKMIDEIKARWAKATPGPWKRQINGIRAAGTVDTCDSPVMITFTRCYPTENKDPDGRVFRLEGCAASNAAAIASAPTDIAYLLQEIERLKITGCENCAKMKAQP